MDTTTVEQGAVVVGVDGSAGSGAALEWAVGYAQQRRRPLLIVNGAGDPRRSSQLVGLDDARRELRTEARRVTEQALAVARRIAPELDIGVAAPLHDARQALLDLAERASIVVVGTRGLGPVRALLLGSVSTALAAHAVCPVAVVRPAERDQDGRAPVVVGADGTEASIAALDLAFEVASTERRPLVAVHSWSSDDTFADPASYQQGVDAIQEHTRVLAESLAGYEEKYPDVSAERRLPRSSAPDTLVELSETAALVVVGSRGRSGLRSLAGSVSRAVVEHAHCTVVVTRP
jgi:nucleotide-binding universal stress UspA family protein